MAKVAYTVVIERATGNYSAYVPDLSDCVVAADTVDECLKLMAEAIPFHIKGLQEDGEAIPPPLSTSRMVETELAVA